jgi:hypothetical protein
MKNTGLTITDEMYERFLKAYEPFEKEEILKVLFDAQVDLSAMVGMLIYSLQNFGNCSGLSDEDYTTMLNKIKKLQHNRKVFLKVISSDNFEFRLKEDEEL